MKYIFCLFTFLFMGCIALDNRSIEQFSWNNGDFIYKDRDSWYVESSGFIYPGDDIKINAFIETFESSNSYKINDNPGDLIDFYNISSNRVGEYIFGLLTPGSIGRYVLKNSSLYFLEGDIANYQFTYDFRYKGFNFSSNKAVYFHFKPVNNKTDSFSEILKFDNDSTLLLHNLMRLDFKDLLPGFDGELIGEVEIKFDDGSIEIISIKKGADGYLLNHLAPYSLVISEISFKNLINSF